jgi:hypothetical protein
MHSGTWYRFVSGTERALAEINWLGGESQNQKNGTRKEDGYFQANDSF